MIVWYTIASGAVLGTGMIHILEENGKRIIDSKDWNEETQKFIENYDRPIEEPGPWWYHSDGNLYRTPPVP